MHARLGRPVQGRTRVRPYAPRRSGATRARRGAHLVRINTAATELTVDRSGGLDYKVAVLALAEFGRKEITLAEHEMPGLMSLRREYAEVRPLAGARISGSLHMTVQTAVLIETLVDLGADVRWASCNIFSTQDHAAAAVVVGRYGTVEAPQGIPVFAWKGETLPEYWWCTDQMLRWPAGRHSTGPEHAPGRRRRRHPAGAQGCAVREGRRRAADRRGRPDTPRSTPSSWTCCAPRWPTTRSTGPGPRRRSSGVTEETTTGVQRLYQLAAAGELLFPAINVNDSVTKSKFDNKYGIRHSLIDGINRGTDVLIGGKVALVAGYGDVGKGCAESLRGQGARVVIAEIDPICALQALMDGFEVTTVDEAIDRADIVITTTGNKDIVTVEHMQRMKHQAILGNIGHFDNEIDMAGLARSGASPDRDQAAGATSGASRRPHDHRAVRGPAAEPGQRDRPPVVRDEHLFSNQVIAQIELFTKPDEWDKEVYRLPKHLDEKVARIHVEALGGELTKLTKDQAEYIGVDVEGPFKPEHYRY